MDTKLLAGIKARIIKAEVDENDQEIDRAEIASGMKLKEELVDIIKHPESVAAFEKDLKNLGLRDEQFYKRKKIMEAVLEYIESL